MGVFAFVAMISPADAEAAIRNRAVPLSSEPRSLALLQGAVLDQPINAVRDQPPFDRTYYGDGIALSSKTFINGRREFRVAGTQAAGAAPLDLREAGDCLEVMTGAMLPRGCDCVIPVEKITRAGDVVQLMDDVHPQPFLNVHARGSDVREGERLLQSGIRLGPAEIALIASNGQPTAKVASEPRITVTRPAMN